MIDVQDIKKKKPERAFDLKDGASNNDRYSDSRTNSDSELDDESSQQRTARHQIMNPRRLKSLIFKKTSSESESDSEIPLSKLASS